MSKVVDTLFGGVDRSAQRANELQNNMSRDFITKQEGQAQQALSGGYGQAGQAMRGGAQAALDVYGQTIPSQLQAINQGSMAAQNNLLSGLPAFQSAVLGTPFNMNHFQQLNQPQSMQFDPGMFQQQLPQQHFNPQPQMQPPNPLGGMSRGMMRRGIR